ncbi:MAG: hypothetical protein IIX45_09540 [Lachnospiraceae bacterium]|nr:hypothetical protein [Lachnospiraceae bacterium]
MNRYVKDELIVSFNLIIEANEKLKSFYSKMSKEERFELLQLCQELAIAIGNKIEIYGKYESIIKEIEEYCEVIYKLSIIGDNNIKELEMLWESLFFYTNSAIEKLKKIKTKKEVVFLPYKAAMWDCFESIWFLIKDEDEYEVTVISIPYFEYNSITGIMEPCCDKDKFPNYVKIVSEDEYILEERRPDIIFIHNPYDNFNRVTSVENRYFSSNLKKYTDKLVYIPYYMTGGTEPESHTGLPVYKNMDYIIIQSQKLVSQYTKLGIDKEKILPLGSPKIEAILRISEQRSICDKWENKINGRKVYFLNTSISGLLENNERAFEKIEEIFEIFEDKKDSVLLWRPHPLLESTIKAMRPALKKRYDILREKMEKMDNVIIDYSPNVSCAVAVSDMYIGEETSSIVHLFGATGKPVFLLNMKNRYNRTRLVEGIQFFKEEDYIWFTHCRYNVLCRMNLKNGRTNIISKLPNEKYFGERAYRGICKVESKVYCIPQWGAQLSIVDLDTKAVETIDFSGEGNVGTYFLDGIYLNGKIYMIPTRYPAIVEFDVKDNSFNLYKEGLESLRIGGEGSYAFDYTIKDNRYMCIPGRSTNAMLIFDTETKKSDIKYIDKSIEGIICIDYDGENFWMMSADGTEVIIWNEDKGILKRVKEFPEEYKCEEGFLGILCCSNYVYMIPKKVGSVLRVDKKTFVVDKFDIFNDNVNLCDRLSENHNWANNTYFAGKISSSEIIIMRAYDNKMIVYDEQTDERKISDTKLEALAQFDKQGENLPYAIRENELMSIQDFINTDIANMGFDANEEMLRYGRVVDNINGCGQVIVDIVIKNND